MPTGKVEHEAATVMAKRSLLACPAKALTSDPNSFSFQEIV